MLCVFVWHCVAVAPRPRRLGPRLPEQHWTRSGPAGAEGIPEQVWGAVCLPGVAVTMVARRGASPG